MSVSYSALNDIKVLDLSRVLAGPSCTQILADLGADVIKIERPILGDETRHWHPPSFPDGTSAYFATANRNKKSLAIDISHPQGQAIIHKLATEADVFVENFKVGSLKKYGLDYESLKKTNPRLIYASLTGFGQTGPDAHKPGYDYIVQGMSGLMSITGPSNGLPYKVGVAVVDLFAGLQLTIGIQAALLARTQTGLGQLVDVSLLDTALAMTANVGMNYLATHKTPSRLGNAHPNIVPYQTFKVKNEQYLILACGNDSQFSSICNAMQSTWHTDSRFKTNPNRVLNRDALITEMEKVFLQKSRDEWLTLFEEAGIPSGPINSIAEAMQMPQILHRQMIIDFSDKGKPIRSIANPIKLSQNPVQYHSPPPNIGEHTLAILRKYYSDEEIQFLRENQVI